MIVFDYVFYRVAKFFFKKDGIDAIRAICTISVIQGLISGALVFSILRLIYGVSEIAKYTKVSGKIGMALGILLLVANYFRYKGKYWRFADKWKNNETPQEQKIRGVLVVFAILIPLLLVFWMGTSGYRQ